MATYFVQLTLLSDTTFSRGDGVAGLIDREVEHDQYGLPFLHGRTLKGLLGEEADNLLDVLEASNGPISGSKWETSRNKLFGVGGSTHNTGAALHFGHAQLPKSVRHTVQESLKDKSRRLTRQDVLASLTAVRRQTSVNGDGIPHDGSLRSMRVILRQTTFTAEINGAKLSKEDIALLAASVLALRRAGTGRNRGRGKLKTDLLDNQGNSILQAGYDTFTSLIPEVQS